MVEPVSSSAGKARVQRAGNDTATAKAGALEGLGNAAAGARLAPTGAEGAKETVSISEAAKALPAELKGGPPIDLESVARIKEAIAENRYPIDLQAITESLYQSFLEITR